MDFIKEMQQTKEVAMAHVIDLIITGIKSNYIHRKEGHHAWKEKCADWVCVSFAFGTANSNEIQSHYSGVKMNVRDNMSEIESRVNAKLGVKAIEYRVDRLNHYFKLML
jgi:hypothetical protein